MYAGGCPTGTRAAPSVAPGLIDHAQPTARELLGFAQLEPAANRRRGEECLSLTRDQRVNDQPYLVHQPGVDGGGDDRGAAHQVDVFALFQLESSQFAETPEESRVRPCGRSQGA